VGKNLRKKSKLTTSADVLQSLLQNSKSPLSDQFLRWKLWCKWAEVVGPSISERTLPVGYHEGVLYLWVKNSVWMQQMVFLAQPLREKINKYVGKSWVRRVQFTLDKREVPGINDSPDEMRAFLEKE
jgi:predicted nucleic acid-binding Zn ribbon protein